MSKGRNKFLTPGGQSGPQTLEIRELHQNLGAPFPYLLKRDNMVIF